MAGESGRGRADIGGEETDIGSPPSEATLISLLALHVDSESRASQTRALDSDARHLEDATDMHDTESIPKPEDILVGTV